MKHLGNITKLHGDRIEAVDVISGGSPCQNLSVAGGREGLEGSQSRLFLDMVRIIKEMRENDKRQGRSGLDVRPRFMVFENVTGLLSIGDDFRIVLESIARIADEAAVVPRPPRGEWSPSGAIVGDGWSIAWRVHDAKFWGVAQRRKRLAIVADFADEWGSCEVLFEREGLSGDSEPSRETREETSRTIEDRVDSTGEADGVSYCYPMEGNGARPSHMGNGWTEDDVGYTLNATERHAVAYRKTAHPRTADEGQGWERTDCNDTLNTFDMTEARSSTIVVDPDRTEQSRTVYDARGNSWTETAPTLTGDHQRRVTDYTALIEDGPERYCIGNGQADQLRLSKHVGTLNCMHDQQAILSFQERGCKEGGGKGILIQSDHVGALGGSANQRVQVETAVRRLTPLEAERLQGFPDGWTDIGEWVDSKGRTRQTTDSARYKALGNSLAVGYANQHRGFWMWLMKRITERLGRTGTLGSLFDGIGGFPLAWETYNGKGSARWASEIEDFCIAVTKKRFGED